MRTSTAYALGAVLGIAGAGVLTAFIGGMVEIFGPSGAPIGLALLIGAWIGGLVGVTLWGKRYEPDR